MRVSIKTRKDYEQARKEGFEPLIDKNFEMPIKLRVELQRELFGKNGNQEANQKFYAWTWNYSDHWCSECMLPLYDYSATYISHILTRGAHPEMAHDPRNINILCPKCHNTWEHATTRGSMRIYLSNLQRIDDLTKEYNDLAK